MKIQVSVTSDKKTAINRANPQLDPLELLACTEMHINQSNNNAECHIHSYNETRRAVDGVASVITKIHIPLVFITMYLCWIDFYFYLSNKCWHCNWKKNPPIVHSIECYVAISDRSHQVHILSAVTIAIVVIAAHLYPRVWILHIRWIH